MKTRLPFSTISYNTEEYLKGRLQDLVKARVLSEWYFIAHKPEDDEAGNKEHFHLLMFPAKTVQTDDVRQALAEFDPQKPDKPRKCLSCRSSKFGSWYMYAIHDRAYLASKDQARRFHYKYEDIRASDPDILHERFCDIDVVAELGAFKAMEEAMDRGLTFEQFFLQGRVPVQQTSAYRTSWEIMLQAKTERAGRPGHDLVIDQETGEIVAEARKE